MNPTAVQIANEALWRAHPELGGRQLANDPADRALREEWQRLYAEASAKKPPPPAVVPAVVAPPPELVPAVITCGALPPPTKVTDCKSMKSLVQEGDIVLRGERGDAESEFIAKVSGCDYSHTGMVVKNAAGELVVVDAYPGRPAGAVSESPVDDFFCGHGATQGLAARPKSCAAAQKAAQWALKQTKDPDYKFDLWDPWNHDPKRVYCADFVYQSFQNAGVDLVPVKTDMLDAAHRSTTLAEARKMAGGLAKIAPDKKIEAELRKRTGGSSEYITPCQMAVNAGTDTTVVYESSVAAGGAGTKKH